MSVRVCKGQVYGSLETTSPFFLVFKGSLGFYQPSIISTRQNADTIPAHSCHLGSTNYLPCQCVGVHVSVFIVVKINSLLLLIVIIIVVVIAVAEDRGRQLQLLPVRPPGRVRRRRPVQPGQRHGGLPERLEPPGVGQAQRAYAPAQVRGDSDQPEPVPEHRLRPDDASQSAWARHVRGGHPAGRFLGAPGQHQLSSRPQGLPLLLVLARMS